MYKYLLLSVVLLVGCTNPVPPRDDFKSEIAMIIVRNNIEHPDWNTAVEQIVKYDRKDCPECKGTGIITSGDGFEKTKCDYCEVKGISIVADLPILPELNVKCCPDCICGDNCQCDYPGQCLIAKQNGWPVSRCDGDECRTYYPKDAEGNDYNPYLQIPANQRYKYKGYDRPIPVDANGNRILMNGTNGTTNSRNCAGCR
jgi:hypothetical protein